MLAIVYLFICIISGSVLLQPLTADREKSIWMVLAASFGFGTLFVTWLLYGLACLYAVVFHVTQPLTWANGTILILFSAIVSAWLVFNNQRLLQRHMLVPIKRSEEFFFLMVFVFFLVLFTFSFHESSDGTLYIGRAISGDFAPHTAIIRSFSRMDNYPTGYPHFGRSDMRYHFMLYFLIGNLEYLGLRIDIAFNLVSAVTMVSLTMVLTEICRKMGGGIISFFLVFLMMIFRSGTAFFRFFAEHLQAGDLMKALRENMSFLGYTPNEDWGMYGFNVFMNQRHLAFVLIICAILIWYYMGMIWEGNKGDRQIRFRDLFFSKTGWIPDHLGAAVLTGIALGLCGFWNGVAVIASLIVLFVFSVFSIRKVEYLIMAILTVSLSYLQTRLFMNGSAVSPCFIQYFLSEEKTFYGYLKFLFLVTGVSVLGLVFAAFLLPCRKRIMILAFLMPMIFGSFVGLTRDIAGTNHKYFVISFLFLSTLWAVILERLLKESVWKKVIALILTTLLTVTGMYDFYIILRKNSKDDICVYNDSSELTRWINNNVRSDELILCPFYSLNEITLSGAQLYCGWAVYAWAMGYDTDHRVTTAQNIFSETDVKELSETVEAENIDYIIFGLDMVVGDIDWTEDLISSRYRKVFDGEGFRVYDTHLNP